MKRKIGVIERARSLSPEQSWPSSLLLFISLLSEHWMYEVNVSVNFPAPVACTETIHVNVLKPLFEFKTIIVSTLAYYLAAACFDLHHAQCRHKRIYNL